MVGVDEVGGGERRWIAWERVLVWVLFVGAFAVRLWGVSLRHGWDENVYLQNAELICCGKNNYNEIDSRPPLLSLLFAGAFWVWHSDYAAYVVTALLNALGPVFLYLAGRMFVGRQAAGIAALLLAFTPFFVSVFPAAAGSRWVATGFVSFPTGHSVLSDSPALTLILLAFWLLLRGVEKDSDREFAGAGFVLAMAVLMRFPSLASVGVLSLLTLAATRWWRAGLACAAGFAVGVAPYLGWSRWRYGGFLATLRSGWDNFSGPGQSFFYYLKYSGAIFGWVALAGLVLWGVRRGWEALHEGSEPRGVWVREGFLWVWALVLVCVFSALGHKEPRYVMPVAPPVFLLAGVGLSGLLKGRRGMARVVGPVVLVGALCWEFWPVRERFATGFVDRSVSEEMQVSAFLNASVPPATILYMNLSYADFAHYTDFKVQALPESGADLYDSIQRLPHDGIFIAYKTFDPGVAPEPAIGWLDANPHFRRVREFPTMVVYAFHVK
jgi:4-amino-4-deoxy-L-arabinose transferase-like glycosyltransferase